MREHKRLARILITIFGIALLLFFVGGFFASIHKFNDRTTGVIGFNEGWVIDINGKTESIPTLSEYGIKSALKRGDIVTITNTLPAGINGDATLRVLIYLSGVEAFVDGEKIYSYGMENIAEGKFVGSGYHYIILPDDCAGKTVSIVFYPNEIAAFTSIPEIDIAETDYIYVDYYSHNTVQIFASVFLFVIGFFLAFLGLVAQTRGTVFRRLIPIGVFSLMMGLWTMCSIKFIGMFSVQREFNTALEYISLYFALPPLMILILMMRTDAKKWKRFFLGASCVILILFAAAMTVLHFLNVVHISVPLTAFHILAALSVISVIIVGMRNPREMPIDEILVNLGLVEMLVFGVIDILRFNVQKYIMPEADWLSTSVLPVGTMVFIVILLISYLLYVYNIGMDKTKEETLTKMAYEDPMTGLYNRAKCDEMFEQFDSKHDAECTLILCDLNGLKKANDTYGHEAGDLLITTFAKILQVAFEGHSNLFRMGGDEFLIMINHRKNESHLKSCLLKMIMLEREVSKKHPFPIECSYGVAYSTEVKEHKADKVYMLADERMYKMKMKSKNKRVD